MKRQQQTRPFAKRSLGQNFLIDPNYIRKIIDALSLSKLDTVIEIGPGRGALTEKLIESGANVVAIEIDRDLVPQLADRFANDSNFSLVEADALEVNFGSLVTTNSKLVANLPYNISTAILHRLSDQRNLFSEMVLMFQREVVERITAKPGTSKRGFLTVIVESCFEVEKLFDVPPSAFRPVPKVWSSVVRLIPKSKSNFDELAFRTVVSTAFGQKRKTILNNLKVSWNDAEECLNAAGISIRRRAESLAPDEWRKLTECISTRGRNE
jgi:16S rRNA (adenine1518-N6/adenine1519-N6)-dimethyltransferase